MNEQERQRQADFSSLDELCDMHPGLWGSWLTFAKMAEEELELHNINNIDEYIQKEREEAVN